jgi:hypothetical protein
LSHLKRALKIRIAEYAEDAAQLIEELRSIGTFFWGLYLSLALRMNAGRREQNTNQEKNAQGLNRSSGHDYWLTQRGSAVKAASCRTVLPRQHGLEEDFGDRLNLEIRIMLGPGLKRCHAAHNYEFILSLDRCRISKTYFEVE